MCLPLSYNFITQTASVMTLDENTSAFAVEGVRYYSYSYEQLDKAVAVAMLILEIIMIDTHMS